MAVNRTNQIVKRCSDIIVALVLLIIFSPIMLTAALAVKFSSPGEVVYRQKRLGLNGKVFHLLKFRSMIKNADKKGPGLLLQENDPRITRVGRILRKTGIDELPQLFNVIKGEMSIVGPRPAPIYHLARYDDEQARRLNVKPGITGWAQVNGRLALYWPERIKLDLWYIENYSLWLDILILFKTVLVVLDRRSSTARLDRKDVDPFLKNYGKE